jgi:hypothetical protein
VSIKGGPYAHFQQALRRGHLGMIRAAAAELPRVDLTDALAICLVMSAEHDPLYDRAAARWLARLVLERPAVGLGDLERALAALSAPPRDPAGARAVLRDLCETHRLGSVAGLLS